MTAIKPSNPKIKLIYGHPVTTSTAIADFFGKRHDNVLRDLTRLIAEAPPEFNALNFAAVEYTDSKGEKRPEYRLTRDGFTLLAMGFTGKSALAWKIKYIEAFNKLEAHAAEVAAKRAERKALAAQQKALAAPVVIEEEALRRLRAGKFVLHFGAGGFMSLFSVSRKAVVAEPEDLADLIADPKGDIGREHLSAIIQAAAKRLG